MPKIVENMCQLFADDAKIFRNVSSREDCIKLQSDYDKLTEWFARWQLPFNVEKCKSLHIGKNNSRHRYVMDIQELEQVREEKDLGVLVDDELKFHRQTAAAVKKANAVLGMLKKSFVLFDEVTLLLLYKSLVRPHLEYGNVTWGPFYHGDIKAVERIQRRATKLVPQIRNLSYEEGLKKLNLSSLTHRRRRGDMVTTYKLVTGRMNLNKEYFFKAPHSTMRRHKHNIFKEHATKFTCINAFSNRIVRDWNELTSDIVGAASINTFKHKLDAYWKDKRYDTPFWYMESVPTGVKPFFNRNTLS